MQSFAPLTFGQVKANKDVIDALGTKGDMVAQTQAAVAFLQISAPGLDLDAESPGAIIKAAFDLYRVTFTRPEEGAPAQTPNP